MKLVQTLVVRDDADAAEAQIAFQLNAGVDFVIAIAPEADTAGAAILERYERGGYLRLLFSTGDTAATDTVALLRESGVPSIVKPFEFARLEQMIREIAAARTAV